MPKVVHPFFVGFSVFSFPVEIVSFICFFFENAF